MTDYKDKYYWKPYSDKYLELFKEEQSRIAPALNIHLTNIEHVGSTAIPGVGGKGIIDIYITCDFEKIAEKIKQLIALGYDYREHASNEQRKFLQQDIDGQMYHIHISDPSSTEYQRTVAFRDYLRKDKTLADKYSEIKKLAGEEALKQENKEEAKNKYMEIKEPVIREILSKLS